MSLNLSSMLVTFGGGLLSLLSSSVCLERLTKLSTSACCL